MKHRILFFLFLAFINNAYTQNNWHWSAGGAGNDEALKNTTDNAGNFLTTGYFSLNASFGSHSITSAGGGDVFVTKQNAQGDYVWAASAGGTLSDRAYSIATDNSGNVLITGFFAGQASFGSVTLTSNNSSQDIFVAKLDAAGNFLWAKSFGGSDIDLAFSIQTDVNGNCILTGQFRDTIQFGANTFISRVNSSTGLGTFDIFILKLDASGNVLWSKQGAADYDDRGITLACDVYNNIYVSGQFSDTLQFTNTYNNNAFNASFVLKLDSAGNEIWFRKLFASQILAYDIKCFNDKVYMAGDFQGTLSVSLNSVILTNTHQYKIFVLQLDSSGTVIASHADGSDNFITSQAIAVDVSGNAYCTGLFKCVFSDFSQPLGNGVFNSVGFRDVFLSKYDSTLQLKWSRHFAGPLDDFCSAITISNTGSPVLAGSFERNFNIPDGGNFSSNISNHDSSSFGPAQVASFCGDSGYGEFISVSSAGNKDIFSTDPFDASRLTYDFFDRPASNCALDTLMPGLNNFVDSVAGCDSVMLFLTTRTGSNGVIGPAYDCQWQNGLTNDTIYVQTTGWYKLNFNYKDQCRIFSDSVYATIYTTPVIPLISTSIGNIIYAIPDQPCPNKLLVISPDTAVLTGSNIQPGYNYYWNTPWGVVNGTSCNAFTSGTYEFYVAAPVGNCFSSQCVEVFYYDVAQPGQCLPLNFSPEIHFIDSVFDATDTVTVCRDDFFDFILVDSTYWTQGILTQVPTFVAWNITGGFTFEYPHSYDTTFFYHLQSVKALSSGNCTITAQVLSPFTLSVMRTVVRNFYLNVLPTPSPNVVINGPLQLCPGDTVLLSVTGGDNYQFSGPGIVATSSNSDSIWVDRPGIYTTFYLVTDTTSGCSDTGYVSFNLVAIPAPVVTIIPSNGIICPNDSVQLIAQPGTSFTWYGPLGNVIGTTQSIYTSIPGIYHYTLTDSSGCTLVSEFEEVKAYTTPYLIADPGPVLCEGGTITLNIFTNDSTQIQWLPPLSGNSLTQIVDSAGTYSCNVTACGITTTVSINISNSNLNAQIIPQGPVTICQNTNLILQANSGMVNYNWIPGGVNTEFYNVTTAGNYSVIITDIYGCTAIDSIVVDTFPLPPPPATNDLTICYGSSATLTASAPGNIYWYSTTSLVQVIDSGSTFITNTLYNNTIFYVTNADSNCQSNPVPVQVFINPVSQPHQLAGDSILCRLDTLSLFAPLFPLANYNWAGPGNFTSSQQNISILNFDTANAGYYYLQISDSQCTGPIDSFLVSLFPFHVAAVSSNSPLCQGDTMFLYIDTISNASYAWSGPNGFTSSMQNPFISNVQQNQSGNYYVTVTEGGCINNPLVVSVLVNEIPPIPVITGNTQYCSGDTILLQATLVGGASYQWIFADSTTLPGSLISIIADTNLAGVVTLIINQNGCTNQNNFTLNITPEPPHSILSNAPVCEHDTLTFSTLAVANALYYWTGPSGFGSSTNSNSIPNSLIQNSGYYTLQVEANGCRSKKDSVLLNVFAYPVFDLISDTTICEGTTLKVEVAENLGSYNWNGVSFSNQFTFNDTGLVVLTVTANQLCETTKSFYVNQINCDVIIPNIFTPQGDGVNDEYEFIYSNAKNISLTVFNRWGKKIKELNGTIIKWDGTNENNEKVSAGTYFYIANVIDYFNRSKNFNGIIEIIK